MTEKLKRCDEHGLYLYRDGFGYSCKLGCYIQDEDLISKEKLVIKLNEIKLKSKDFECCLEICDEILEFIKKE